MMVSIFLAIKYFLIKVCMLLGLFVFFDIVLLYT